MSEKLSALIDGELSEHEQRQLLRDMMRDPSLQQTWDRYHAIRAALRGTEHEVAVGVASRVRAALATEAVAPAAGTPARFMKLTGTIAIAATVAAVTLVGVQQVFGPVPANPQVVQAPAGKSARPIHTVGWEKQKPETARVLNAYLVEHNEFTPASGVSGMLGTNVRVVAYDSKP